MNITEEEAKTKRCQEAFPAAESISSDGQLIMHAMSPVPLTHAGGGGMYGVATGGAPFHCIGSACMAWRWHYDVLDEREKDDAGLPVGYCGKAGEP